jgi:hypothetical protein
MGKATRLYTKEIRVVEVFEHDHFSWQGPLGPRFCRWVAELGDGRHHPHATRMRTTCVLSAYRSTPQEYEGLLTGPSESPSDTMPITLIALMTVTYYDINDCCPKLDNAI